MQTRIDQKAKTAYYQFDSLHAATTWIDATPRSFKWGNSSESEGYATSWDLGAGWHTAREYARNGWLEGAERAQEAIRAFQPRQPAPDTKVDFYGHMPHVPRYCAGAPDSMLRHTNPPTIGSGKVLCLYVSVAIHCEIDATCAANYGIAIAQYINQLESEGLRVELHVVIANDQKHSAPSGWRLAYSIKLKDADQPLDLAVIAFAIGHPAMHRRIGFALMERGAAPASAVYMYPKRAKRTDVIDMPANAYVMNGIQDANKTSRTPESALAAVELEINKAIEQLEGE